MRVLLGCDFFVRYTAQLARGLANRGAEVVLLTRDHDLEFGDVAGASNSFIECTIGSGVVHRQIEGRVRSPGGWRQAAAVRRELRSFDADVVHVQSSITNDPRLLYAAGARPRRYAVTAHNVEPHPGETVSLTARAWHEILLRGAGLIFVHGEVLREELAASKGTAAPIVVTPHGVDRGEATPLPEHPSILFFGRILEYKGLGVLLDAMVELWREQPSATLTIAGSGSVLEHPALDDPRVRLRAGYVADDQVANLFEATTCVVLPYLRASQSGVGALAKTHGRPLVVTSVGSLPELVADGSGVVVTTGDPAGLAAALGEVLGDRPLARRLAEAGTRTASQGANWDDVAELTMAAYRSHLLGEPPERPATG